MLRTGTIFWQNVELHNICMCVLRAVYCMISRMVSNYKFQFQFRANFWLYRIDRSQNQILYMTSSRNAIPVFNSHRANSI
jgi:hypothetical protein